MLVHAIWHKVSQPMYQAHVCAPASERITPILPDTSDGEVDIGTVPRLFEVFANLGLVSQFGSPHVLLPTHGQVAVRLSYTDLCIMR